MSSREGETQMNASLETDRPRLRILVCVRQVPDLEGTFRPDPSPIGYAEEGLVFRMNGYDENAVEEAVRIRERLGSVTITAVTVGPARAEAVLRRALEFGADEAVHVLTDEACPLDALETATLIAAAVEGESFDLYLCGVMSEDEQRCQTGPMLAALLDLPCATTVVSEEISGDLRSVTAERELEGGRRHVVRMPLPALLTVQSGINRPRYPSLSNKLRAKRQRPRVVEASTMPAPARCRELLRTIPPPPAERGVLLEGDPETLAKRVADIIHEKTDLL